MTSRQWWTDGRMCSVFTGMLLIECFHRNHVICSCIFNIWTLANDDHWPPATHMRPFANLQMVFGRQPIII